MASGSRSTHRDWKGNFADDDDRVPANYGANYERLVSIKRTYAPDNLFHVNQNIEP